jgi:hypothetical protein
VLLVDTSLTAAKGCLFVFFLQKFECLLHMWFL